MKTWIRSGVALTLLLGGCISSTPPAQFFTLTPEIAESERGSVSVAVDTIGVGPLDLPRYLMRPQMVSRAAGNRLVIDEFARWGDSLDLQLGRTVTQNLNDLCADTLVLPFPWRTDFEPDLRVMGDVTRFDVDDRGIVRLEIRWAVTNVATRQALSIHDSDYVGSADPADPSSIAAGMSGVLAQFSRDAAAAIAEGAATVGADTAAESGR
jgi:uncharacterized lipoprotein YmbA